MMKNRFSEMGRRIKIRRKELGMTQEKLAENLGVSPNHLSGVETGTQNPSIGFFADICNALGVTPDYLLLGSLHANSVPEDIADSLRLCNEEDLILIKKIVNVFVEKNRSE